MSAALSAGRLMHLSLLLAMAAGMLAPRDGDPWPWFIVAPALIVAAEAVLVKALKQMGR